MFVRYCLAARVVQLLFCTLVGVTWPAEADESSSDQSELIFDNGESVPESHIYVLDNGCYSGPVRQVFFYEAIVVRSLYNYRPGVVCKMTFNTSSPDIGLIVAPTFVQTRDRLDNLTLSFDGSAETVELYGASFNVSSKNRIFITDSRGLTINWTTARRPNSGLRGFHLVVTAFKASCAGNDIPKVGCFECAFGERFISRTYVCDGRNNCGDLSDENCDLLRNDGDDSAERNFIGVIVLSVCILTALVCFLWLRSRSGRNSEGNPEQERSLNELSQLCRAECTPQDRKRREKLRFGKRAIIEKNPPRTRQLQRSKISNGAAVTNAPQVHLLFERLDSLATLEYV